MADVAKLAQEGQIVSIHDGTVISFALTNSVFISSFDMALRQGWAVHLNEARLRPDELVKIFAALHVSSQATVKVIGPEKLCQFLVQALAKEGVLAPVVSLRAGYARLLFYPREGRVRVEKDDVPKGPSKIRVLVVDDSKTIRDLLQKIFSHDPAFEVVGLTGKPLEVLGLVDQLKPDVITMDIQMPDMNGVVLVKKVMEARPTPTVMITSMRLEDGTAVLTALENGAVDYIQKPSFQELEATIPVILEKVKCAARANLVRIGQPSPRKIVAHDGILDTGNLVAIGSSTGGPEALRVILTQTPKTIPPILIVQHIPAVFSAAFAQRMNDLCPFEVKEAKDGDSVEPGRVLVAPGGMQMEFRTRGDRSYVAIHDGPPLNRHKPSVDVLFNSVAENFKGHMTGVILTGMGADGAKGLLKMKQSGAYTIAQSERSCVVFGMPREALQMGAADEAVDLEAIPEHLVRWLCGKRPA